MRVYEYVLMHVLSDVMDVYVCVDVYVYVDVNADVDVYVVVDGDVDLCVWI